MSTLFTIELTETIRDKSGKTPYILTPGNILIGAVDAGDHFVAATVWDSATQIGKADCQVVGHRTPNAELEGKRVTLFTTSGFDGTWLARECSQMEWADGKEPYGHGTVLFLKWRGQGKKKLSQVALTKKRDVVVVEGWGHPAPMEFGTPVPSSRFNSITYNAFDPAMDSHFDTWLKQQNFEVLMDCRKEKNY